MFDRVTCEDSASATSSPESAFGATRYAVPDGGMIDLFGPVPVRANLSARQAKELGLLTSGTCGRPSSGLSKSVSLQSSLESKLRARLSMTGSTLYTLTWKPWVTPSGVSRFRLRASVRRTSATATTGWPTPTARDGRGYSEKAVQDWVAGMTSNGHNLDLDLAGKLAGWATPAARDWTSARAEFLAERAEQSRGKPLSEQAFTLAGWPTARATDGENNARTLQGAINEAERKSWNNDLGVAAFSVQLPEGPARLTATGLMLTGSDAGMESGGQLDPNHSRWLQGLPPEWCACAVMAMQLMPSKRVPGSKR